MAGAMSRPDVDANEEREEDEESRSLEGKPELLVLLFKVLKKSQLAPLLRLRLLPSPLTVTESGRRICSVVRLCLPRSDADDEDGVNEIACPLVASRGVHESEAIVSMASSSSRPRPRSCSAIC